MSTKFAPLTLPPGVVATATKKMASTNYAEVNMVRWVEGQLAPIGGQTKYNFTFASRCKAIHGWYDLDQTYNVAYLCESNLYVARGDGSALIDITPTGGIVPPTPPNQGGYGDDAYNTGPPDTYGTPRVLGADAAIDRIPDVFSLQNFGAILLAMTSADGRLLHWDPAVPGPGTGGALLAIGAFTTSSPNISMISNPGWVIPGMTAYDLTTNQYIGVVSSYVGTALVLTANAAHGSLGSNDTMMFGYQPAFASFTTSSPVITMLNVNPGWITPGMGVYDLSNNKQLGNVLTYVGTTLTLTANALFASAGSADLLQFTNSATVVAPKSGSTVPNGRCFVVTSERFVQIFGSYNDGTAGGTVGGSFRRFAWCEQEDFTNWSYSDLTTQAGFIDIEPSSPIITAIATRTGTLFWTGKKAYRSRYLGAPYIYNYDELGDNCTPWSPQSMATTSSMVLWFSQQGPYSYDGTSILPVQCMARAWIDDDIDLLNVREQACAVHVGNFSEFWWFFPQGPQSNPSGFNTRAVIYNYKEGWWGQARCARSAGITASYTSHTIMANGTVSYEHENGFIYWDCDLPWIETFDLNVGGGKLITLKQIMPDIEGDITNVLYSLFYRNSRSVGLPELRTTPQPVRSNGYVDFRTTGRDMRLRIDLAIPAGQIITGVASDGGVYPVTVGQHLIDAVPRGDR